MAKVSNASLHRASHAKNDEFYTQLSDIEKELKHYKEQFRGKVVYCNCDDPYESNFFKFFAAKFEGWGLKKLITTSYVDSPIANVEPCKLEIETVAGLSRRGVINHDDLAWLIEHNEGAATRLQGNGDFRSEECMVALAEADIVCTNPPFSLFREYVTQLAEFGKEFLVIGNKNAITYKEIFRLIKEDRLWLGYTSPSEFYTPNGTLTRLVQGLTRWFTNLDAPKRHEKLVLYKRYTPDEFPKYDNYDAIEVSRVVDIPRDYDDAMGVPVTFLDKWNPDQFEIVGMAEDNGKGFSGGLWDGRNPHCVVHGANKFKRLFIRPRR